MIEPMVSMTGDEIRNEINFNNKKIQSLMDPSVFILQPEIQKYMEDNEYLRSICPHKYKNGTCIYCGTPAIP